MVECSPTLRKVQYDNLKCTDEAVNEEDHTKRTISMLSGAPISWHSTLEEVPSGCMVFFNPSFSIYAIIYSHILVCKDPADSYFCFVFANTQPKRGMITFG